MKDFSMVVNELIKRKETVSTMESCTGGAVVDAITSISGASDVLKFSAVPYSNEFKIKMGVEKEIIDKYSVYSMETAHEMALKISKFASSDFGIGITGKLNKVDKNNNFGEDNKVFISIFYKNKFYDMEVFVNKAFRIENKNFIVEKVIAKMEEILNENNKVY